MMAAAERLKAAMESMVGLDTAENEDAIDEAILKELDQLPLPDVLDSMKGAGHKLSSPDADDFDARFAALREATAQPTANNETSPPSPSFVGGDGEKQEPDSTAEMTFEADFEARFAALQDLTSDAGDKKRAVEDSPEA
eukprot:SAG31_NODE_8214_length_1495_cov_2.056590_1_plen_138_part_10